MKVLVTCPGKYGDVLWSLPTARCLAEAAGEPVHYLVSDAYKGIVPLLNEQPYIARADSSPSWHVKNTAPMTPRVPPIVVLKDAEAAVQIDRVIHLGYPAWPLVPLPSCCWLLASQQWSGPSLLPPLDLETPWINVSGPGAPIGIAVGFTDEWYELKLGLACIVGQAQLGLPFVLCPAGGRWDRETPSGVMITRLRCDWLQAARSMRNADLFFGDCSALHVLACALGKRCVLMEPAEQRHHPIFYPYGKAGPRVTLVIGNDGEPTFDARHCADAIREALASVGAK